MSGWMTEKETEQAFVAWLTNEGWIVATEHQGFVDVVATRDDVTLYAEVKGHTRSPGAAVDIGYGQLLRRMGIGAER